MAILAVLAFCAFLAGWQWHFGGRRLFRALRRRKP